jgi:hypothetical protein
MDFVSTKSTGRTQIIKYFNSSELKYSVPLIPSSTTYQGMVESLRIIAGTNDQDKTFVLCPYYRWDPRKQKGCDTQAGGGGKPVRWQKSPGVYEYETPQNAVMAEMLEELRIYGTKPHLECDSKSVLLGQFGRDKIVDGRPVSIYTTIYSFKVAECLSPATFDTAKYSEPRGEDVMSERVAFIPYGTLAECIALVKTIPVANTDDNIVDGIEAISIVSLPDAIYIAKVGAQQLEKRQRFISGQAY